jgi:peptidoglycan hydrolase-like protein with peptidoglycan-binding domain
VKYLQKALNKLVKANLTVDGEFGKKTQKALITWQSANALTADGIYGAKSETVMKKQL